MRPRFWIFGILILAAALSIAVIGSLAWDVTALLPRAAARLEAATGVHLTAAEVRWTPWKELDLKDVKIQTRGGGRLHVTNVSIQPKMGSIFRGRLTTLWQIGEIRIDPASWGIRFPAAQELLSAGPVSSHGDARIHLTSEKLAIEKLSLQGPMLQVVLQGWVSHERQGNLSLEGAFPRKLLEEMNLMLPAQQAVNPWEPFRMQLEGRISNPQIDFRYGEHTS